MSLNLKLKIHMAQGKWLPLPTLSNPVPFCAVQAAGGDLGYIYSPLCFM